jgi:tetratricopeptide (TPR) repeat protein
MIAMSQFQDKSPSSAQPGIPELLARFLHGQAGAHEAGLAAHVTGEVVPYEAAPSQPADPKLAWEESLAVLSFYAPSFSGGSRTEKGLKAPPDWPALVAAQEPALAVAFCLGNFPQLIRSLQPLLHASSPQPAMASNARPFDSLELSRWASQAASRKEFPASLLAVAALRLAKNFDRADELLPEEADVPSEWRADWANESAALAWHRGQTKEALASWQAQKDTVPVLFNRGMASLFLNKRANARAFLQQAVDQLPEDGAWQHLGRLYLALAEM